MIQGQVVCVTGSARRVGRAIALAFAAAGANVVIHHHASDEDALQTAADAKALGVEALIVKGNLANPDEVAVMFEQIHATFGRLDVMVNSAANYYRNHLLDISYEEWQTVLGVNLTGPFLCTQHAARLMPDGGCIINIGDNGGLRPWKSRPHHSVSKAGLLMLTKVSAASLGERNIRVNCIIPGPVLIPDGEPDRAWDNLAQSLPLKRTGTPTDVAQACLFLATNDFITGAILNVDGGEAIR
ncbi:MAG: SDR family oxidoreductase [Anaerolineales bacterium]|nr:SDR family oxidoreductase [Anaerolineales bacterium]